MQEQLLHFIWYRKLFHSAGLKTTQGQSVEILHTGIPNQDQGPDFLQARIRIEDKLWAGHVEIHIRSSSWHLHGHQADTHYQNVVLHVVWTEDEPVVTATGFRIPCIELEKIVDPAFLQRYKRLMANEEWVPCSAAFGNVQHIIKISWLDRMMSERLEKKTAVINQIYLRCGSDFEQAFFVLLARQLGAPANSEAMENLAMKIPLRLIRRMNDRIDQIEAVLFGVAGMLTKELKEDYPLHLKKEFGFLRSKHGLVSLPSLQWKFLRMRPAHFPTIRIAQLAVLIQSFEHFISLLMRDDDAAYFISLFCVKPSAAYWNDHYHFRSQSPNSEKRLGHNTAVNIIINLVCPFMFFYGQRQGIKNLQEKAIQLLTELPPEKNAVIKGWKTLQWEALHAGHTQGMLHLKKSYCDVRKCLQCAIGLQVLK